MIRELLFMLNGRSGALFVLKENGKFELCAGMADAGLCASEKEMIKPLLKIGSNVAHLISFCRENKPKSFYLAAIKKSVSNCLSEYEEELVKMEEDILDGSATLGVTGIHSRVLPFTFLFEYLKELVEAVKLQNPDCLLMDTVRHYQNHCGVSRIISSIQKIFDSCLKVLHKQLTSWLLFGKILDPYSEFFIYYVDESQSFAIHGEKIPGCLSLSLVQQVLFVGESVHALSQAQDLSEEDWQFIGELQRIPFRNVVDIVQKCRDQMAKRLWSLVTDRGRLNRSLNTIRNTFLMEKGDIFASFIRQSENILDGHFPANQLASNQFALQQRLASVLKKYLPDQEEGEIDRISLNIRPEQEGSGWDRVHLEYKTEWPLGVLIFTPETMETYNKLFRLLLMLRRAHLNLNALWKNVDALLWNGSVLQLRWSLQHVLTHLGQYVHIDVIESQKSLMDRQMDRCDDFDQFRTAHAKFLSIVAAQTFLYVPAMQSCFKDLIDLALKFCKLFVTERQQEAEVAVFDELNVEFDRQMQLLFSLLNGMYQQSPGLSMEPIGQLLLRLDFNYYLTKKDI